MSDTYAVTSSQPSEQVRSAVVRTLDNKWLSRAGNATFALAALRFLYGQVMDSPATILTLVLLGVGISLMAAPYVSRAIQRQQPATKPSARKRVVRIPANPSKSQETKVVEALVRRALERELVALIDEWRLVRNDSFRGTDYGTYVLWEEKTSEFIGALLGESERQRFQSNGDETNLALERQAELRIRALERLRDRPTDWKIFGKTRDEVRAATERRRQLTPEDRIVVAGTPPLARRYEVEARPVADPPSRSAKTARAEAAVTGSDPPQPLESPANELKGALEIERGHGRRLLDALGDMGLASNWRYHRPAKASDVDGWEASIDHLLRDRKDLRDLFHYEPLEPAIRGFLPSLSDGLLHGPERRRLKQRLNQLDRVLERA